jgi:hypothetical protein
MKIHRFLNIIVLIACLVTLGCGSKAAKESSGPFRIVATDTGFEAPKEVPAGLRHILFENRGTQIHEAMLVKLSDNLNPDQYVAAVKAGSLFPKGALDYSGPGLTSPGESVEMWVRIDPGKYIIICWNSGHATRIPVHPFIVTYAISEDPAPKEDVVLKLIDYRFEIEGSLLKGEHVIRIETPGPSMHEMDIFRLHEGKTIMDVKRWRKAPGVAIGGVLDSHDLKRVVWLRKNFSPGRYVFHCEMPVTTNSEPNNQEITHADVGMSKEVEISE